MGKSISQSARQADGPIPEADRFHVRFLCKLVDLPQREVVPLLYNLDLPVALDPATGDIYSSRSELRSLLLEVATAEEVAE